MDTVIRFKKEDGDYHKGHIISCEPNAVVEHLFREIWDKLYDELDQSIIDELDQIEQKWTNAEISYHDPEDLDRVVAALKGGDEEWEIFIAKKDSA